MSGFDDFLASTASPSAGGSFSTNAPRPYVEGVTNNVLGGSVNLSSRTRSVDTELLAHPGGTHGHSLGGTEKTYDTATVQQAAMALYGMSRDEIIALQQKMVSAGYLKPGDFLSGIKDASTAKAYGDLLQDTSAMNMAGDQSTLNDVLAQRAAAVAAQGGVGGTGSVAQGHVQQVSNPADLAAQMQDVARNRLGRKLNQKEIDKFISLYHGLEEHQNSQALAAGQAADAGANSTITGAPNVGTSADDFVSRNMAGEAGAHDVAGQFQNFLSIIKGI